MPLSHPFTSADSASVSAVTCSRCHLNPRRAPSPLQIPSPTAVLVDTPLLGPICPALCGGACFSQNFSGWSRLYSPYRLPRKFLNLLLPLVFAANHSVFCLVMHCSASCSLVTLSTLGFQSLGWVCLGKHPPTRAIGLSAQRVSAELNVRSLGPAPLFLLC